MKNISYLILVGLLIVVLPSCEKNSETLVTKNESISLGAAYSNDIYYRLSDGLITAVPRANWDIAFSVSAREAAILTNGGSGVVLKVYPTSAGWSWANAIDTAGYYRWKSLNNSDTTWTEGAYNMNATGHPNYGWANYDMVSHNLTGVALYIIKTRNGSFKKIWIEKKQTVEQKYTFRYSDLNGSNEKNVTLIVAGKNKNFIYYSLETNAEVDREPDTDKWDIVFTKWVDLGMKYIVTGVLQNIGVSALENADADPLSTAMPATGYKTNSSIIGADWKTFNMTTYQYNIDATRTFYIKDLTDKFHRLTFKTFEGSSTGNITFDVSTVK
jgi:hypothetical protein